MYSRRKSHTGRTYKLITGSNQQLPVVSCSSCHSKDVFKHIAFFIYYNNKNVYCVLYGRFTHLKQKCTYFNLATLNSSHLKSLLGLLGFIASCLQGIHWFEMLSLGAFQSVLSDLSKKGVMMSVV